MNSNSRALQWLVWGFLFGVIGGIAGVFVWNTLNRPEEPLPVLGRINDFTLTNQLGQSVTRADLEGRVTVLGIFFTRCAGPCATLTRRMKEIQDQFPADSPVQFVSLTTDPRYDDQKVLKEYARRFEARNENWHFLTGERDEVYRFITEDLKLIVRENDPLNLLPGEDLFVHSTKFLLIDGQGRIRSYSYDGADAETPKLLPRTVRNLLKEK